MKAFTLIGLMLLCIPVFSQVPANNLCSNSQVITISPSGTTCVSGTNLNATSDGFFNACNAPTGGNEVWYTFIATGTNNTITVNPAAGAGAAQSLVLTINSGNCSTPASLICDAAPGPGGSASASWVFTQGVQVWFEVTTLGAAGNFDVCVTSVTPPPNPGGTCPTATTLCDKSDFTVTTLPVGTSGYMTGCFSNSPQNDSWFQFTVGVTGTIEWTATPNGLTEYDWALYDISAGCPGTQIACNYFYSNSLGAPFGMSAASVGCILDDFCPSLIVTAGNTYVLQIDNFDANGVGFDFVWGGTFKIAPTSSFSVNTPTGCGVVNTGFTNTSVGASSQTWNLGNGNTSAAVSPAVQNYPSPGNYLVALTVSSATGCTQTSTNVVTVKSIPTSTFTNTLSVCVGAAATITYTGTALAAATYTWAFAGGTIISGSGQGPYQVSWATPGVKNVSLLVTENGCVSAITNNNVTVNAIPTSTFTANATACVGQNYNVSYTGTASAAATYAWNFGGAAIVSGSGQGPYVLTWPAAGPRSITLTVTENACVSVQTQVNLTVNSVPTSTFTATPALCVGSSATVTYTGSGSALATYNWNFSGGTISLGSGQGPYQINWASPGIKNLGLTVTENGCTSASTAVNVTVHPIPTSTFTITPSACVNQAVAITYTGSATAGAAFTWNFGGATVISGTGQGPYSISWPVSGTPNVSLSVTENACVSPITILPITINPIPTSTFTIPAQSCAGDTVSLVYTGTGGAGATYNWSYVPASFVSGAGQGPIQISYAGAGAFLPTLTVIQNACTSAVSNQPITVYPIPSSAFTINAVACEGDTLTVTYTGSSLPGATYNWNFGSATVISGAGQGPYLVKWFGAGNYSVSLQVTENSCLSPITSSPILVKPVPIASFSMPIVACQGDTITITYTGNATALATYNWTLGSAVLVSGTGQGPIRVSWNSSGVQNISLQVTENGCSSINQLQSITVNPIPGNSFSLSPLSLCDLNPTTVTYTGSAGPAATYTWNFGSANIISGGGQGPYDLNYSFSGSYPITLQVMENGCTSAILSQNVSVFSTPTSDFGISPIQGCEGEPLIFTYTGTASPTATYAWNFNGGTVVSGSGQGPISVTWPGTGIPQIDLTVTENGCTSITNTLFGVIIPKPTSDFNFDLVSGCENDVFTLTWTGSANGSAFFDWNFGTATIISGSGSGPYTLSWPSAGIHTVTLQIDDFGCTSTVHSESVTIYQIPNTNFVISPSPICTNEIATITYTGNASAAGSFNWNFWNANVISGSGIGPYQVQWNVPGFEIVSLQVSENGCNSGNWDEFVQVEQAPLSVAGANQVICSGDIISLGDPATVGWSYQWIPATGLSNATSAQPNFTLMNPGPNAMVLDYILEVRSGICVDRDTVRITVTPFPYLDIQAVTGQCLTGNSFNFTSGGTFLPSANVNWIFGPDANPTVSSVQNPNGVTFQNPGSYTIYASINQNGCPGNLDSTIVDVYPMPVADFSSDIQKGCPPLEVQFIDQSTGEPAVSHAWNFGAAGSSTDSDPLHVFPVSGVYNVSLTVTTADGCTSTATQPNYIEVDPLPQALAIADPIRASILNPLFQFSSVGFSVDSCFWDMGDGNIVSGCDIQYAYADTGKYEVTLYTVSINGCIDSIKVNVFVDAEYTLYVPNAFTPNGDGKNDLFRAIGQYVNNFEMIIFNRLGAIAFETNDINAYWDGKFKGTNAEAPQGVYYYILKAQDSRGRFHEIKGNLSLIR